MSTTEKVALNLSLYLGIAIIIIACLLAISMISTHNIKTVKGTVDSIYSYNDYISITLNDITYNIKYPNAVFDIQKNDKITMKLENTNYFFYDDNIWNTVSIIKEN